MVTVAEKAAALSALDNIVEILEAAEEVARVWKAGKIKASHDAEPALVLLATLILDDTEQQ
jgi:hypothetical protein